MAAGLSTLDLGTAGWEGQGGCAGWVACVLSAPRFYLQCEGHEPTLLLIKTTQKEVRSRLTKPVPGLSVDTVTEPVPGLSLGRVPSWSLKATGETKVTHRVHFPELSPLPHCFFSPQWWKNAGDSSPRLRPGHSAQDRRVLLRAEGVSPSSLLRCVGLTCQQTGARGISSEAS